MVFQYFMPRQATIKLLNENGLVKSRWWFWKHNCKHFMNKVYVAKIYAPQKCFNQSVTNVIKETGKFSYTWYTNIVRYDFSFN